MKIRTILISASAAFGLLTTSALAQPQESWSAEGFKVPESALLDVTRGVLYVSNWNGNPTDNDGNGYISKLSPNGTVTEAEWVTGLDAPKGLALRDKTLYVSDIDKLVAIDVESGKITGTWTGEGAQFLNDTAIDADGNVYVSDMMGNSIYRLAGDTFEAWLKDEKLQHPNGLHVEGGKLIVGAWGQDIQPDFTTKTPGHLLSVDLASKAISDVGSGEPIGNLDGVEPDGTGNWLVTDWIKGALLRIRPDGTFEQVLDLNQGSADHEVSQDGTTVLIPMGMDGKVTAYKLQ
jgi:sugar lactone lactonase YvrE